MKTNLLFLYAFALTFIFHCSAAITVARDDFKNASVITFKDYYYAEEDNYTHLLYFKYITEKYDKGTTNAQINIDYTTTAKSGKFSDKAFIQIDGINHNLKVSDRNEQASVRVDSNVDQSGKDLRTTVSSKRILSGTIQIPKEVFEKLKTASSIKIRLYEETAPLTINFSENSLKDFRNYIKK